MPIRSKILVVSLFMKIIFLTLLSLMTVVDLYADRWSHPEPIDFDFKKRVHYDWRYS